MINLQSQFKNHSTTIKIKKEKRKKHNGAILAVYNCKCKFQFIIADARACKGVVFVDLFGAIFEKDFKKGNSCFGPGQVFEFGKVWPLINLQSQFKNHSKGKGEKKQWGQKGCL